MSHRMAENGSGNQNLHSTLCKTGCGFYGNPAFEGMCSKCYKDTLKRKNATPSPPPISSGRATPSGSLGFSAEDVASAVSNGASASTSSTSTSPVTTESSSNGATATPTTTPSVETATPTVTVPSASSEKDKEASTSQDDAASSIGDADSGAASPASTTDSDSKDGSDKDKKPKKNRCHTCKKKVGLTGFQCRCGGMYCSIHRYSDKHECTFDYKEHGQEQIRKANPVVVREKIQKL